ncbi:MAG: thiamine phosphate synthase, partial [Clostridia bacterium]|nr:thiamine phosphate synthase [Clostridia bacterium]
EVLKAIRALGAKPAISISPDTKAEVIFPLLPLCDMVLVMTVYPGFGGQKLIPACLEKVKELKAEMARQGLNIPVEADGGIGAANLESVLASGVDVVVAGSAVFGATDPMAAVRAMREIEKSVNA